MSKYYENQGRLKNTKNGSLQQQWGIFKMLEDREIKNAKIKSTFLGREDHGILTLIINLEYGGCGGQGYGLYSLDTPNKADYPHNGRRVGTAFGMEAIGQILQVVGVSSWEELPGKSVRADASWDKVYRLGHYLEDKWVDIDSIKKEVGMK